MKERWKALKTLKQSEFLVYIYIRENRLDSTEVIAKELELTKPVINQAINKLNKLGLIQETETIEKGLKPNKPAITTDELETAVTSKLSANRYGLQASKKMQSLGLNMKDQRVLKTILNYDISQVLSALSKMEEIWLEINDHAAYFSRLVPGCQKEILDRYPCFLTYQENEKPVTGHESVEVFSKEFREKVWLTLGRSDRAREVKLSPDCFDRAKKI